MSHDNDGGFFSKNLAEFEKRAGRLTPIAFAGGAISGTLTAILWSFSSQVETGAYRLALTGLAAITSVLFLSVSASAIVFLFIRLGVIKIDGPSFQEFLRDADLAAAKLTTALARFTNDIIRAVAGVAVARIALSVLQIFSKLTGLRRETAATLPIVTRVGSEIARRYLSVVTLCILAIGLYLGSSHFLHFEADFRIVAVLMFLAALAAAGWVAILYRQHRGYFGTNTYEAIEVIQVILREKERGGSDGFKLAKPIFDEEVPNGLATGLDALPQSR